MAREGGSGHWTAREERLSKAEYVVCIRNRREQWAATDVEHGTAFLIGKVVGTSKAPYEGRTVIRFSEYAEIHVPDAWKKLTGGQRFPVAYFQTDALFEGLGLDSAQLTWHPFQPVQPTPEKEEPKSGTPPIAAAKEWLAQQLGIDATAIEIHIRA
jgi:hypothetical protein